MKTILVLFLFSLSAIIIAAEKDLKQKPQSFNNPATVLSSEISTSGVLDESFNDATFPPAGWLTESPDNGTGWERITAGTSPLPGWQGGTATPAHENAGVGAAYATWTTGGTSGNDQWLISSAVANIQPGDSLIFWIRKFSAYADNIDVRISTTTQSAAGMTVVVDDLVFATDGVDTAWTRYAYNIGSLVAAGSTIYIGFREHVADNFNDGAAIFLDEVKVTDNVVPVELTSFAAQMVNNSVHLNWATASETNNNGFEVQRKSDNSDYVTIGFVSGKGTTTQTNNYSYVDKNIDRLNHTYRLKQVDFDGTFEYSNEVNVEVNNLPTEYSLNQNYPNPFNPSTVISYALPFESNVKVTVFSALGEEVSELVNSVQNAGFHEFNFDAKNLSSGLYFYNIEATALDGSGQFSSIKKMLLVR